MVGNEKESMVFISFSLQHHSFPVDVMRALLEEYLKAQHLGKESLDEGTTGCIDLRCVLLQSFIIENKGRHFVSKYVSALNCMIRLALVGPLHGILY